MKPKKLSSRVIRALAPLLTATFVISGLAACDAAYSSTAPAAASASTTRHAAPSLRDDDSTKCLNGYVVMDGIVTCNP